MGEKFEVYLDQQYIGQVDEIAFDMTSASEIEPGTFASEMELEIFPASEELSFEMELSGLALDDELWELIRKAIEAGEKAAQKLEEWAVAQARAFAAWNEVAEFASETAEEKRRPRYKQGVSIRECRTDVTGCRWIVDRLPQENKPPG